MSATSHIPGWFSCKKEYIGFKGTGIYLFGINIFPAHNLKAGRLQEGNKEVSHRRKSTTDDQPGKLEALSTSLKHLPMIYLKLPAFKLLGYTTASSRCLPIYTGRRS
jgi:hypothetical protein